MTSRSHLSQSPSTHVSHSLTLFPCFRLRPHRRPSAASSPPTSRPPSTRRSAESLSRCRLAARRPGCQARVRTWRLGVANAVRGGRSRPRRRDRPGNMRRTSVRAAADEIFAVSQICVAMSVCTRVTRAWPGRVGRGWVGGAVWVYDVSFSRRRALSCIERP